MVKILENFEKAQSVRDACEKILENSNSTNERRVLLDLYDLNDSSLVVFYDAMQYAIKQTKKTNNHF